MILNPDVECCRIDYLKDKKRILSGEARQSFLRQLARYSEKRETRSCRFNKISTLINSARQRVSVIRSLARVASGNVIARAKVGRSSGGRSRWHKDDWSWGRTIPRIVFHDLLSSRDGPPSNIHELPNAESSSLPRSLSVSFSSPRPPIVRRPPGSPYPFYLPYCSTSPYPFPSFFPLPLWATHLPRLALSSPNGRSASILTTALRIYFGAPCLNRSKRQRETLYSISSVLL